MSVPNATGKTNTLKEQTLQNLQRHLTLIQDCISEVEVLQTKLQARRKPPYLTTRLPPFIRSMEKDRSTAAHLVSRMSGAGDDPDDSLFVKLAQRADICTTSIGHATRHWAVLKRCRDVVSIDQTFEGSVRADRHRLVAQKTAANDGTLTDRDKASLHRELKEKAKVDVDVVCGGDEWLIIRTLRPSRLARHMTDCGWSWGEHKANDDVDPDEWKDVPLAEQVMRLVAAARLNRHDYRCPQVTLVLPNLSRETRPDFASFFTQLERIDPVVKVVVEDSSGAFLTRPPPPTLDAALDAMMGDELAGLSPTLNLDHTILVDLISDLTHCQLEPQPWQAPTTRAQIEEERRTGGLMVQTLYPLLEGRDLVCTREAAAHLHNMLKTVGTPTERRRGHLLVPLGAEEALMSASAIRAELQSLSLHPLPATLRLPARIVHEAWDVAAVEQGVGDGRLPRVALDVARVPALDGTSKLSVYMFGWAARLVTVTSNKEIAGQMRTWVEANRHADDERGPRIWKVEVTRNLLAKSASPPDGHSSDEDSG